ncbi:hypothetical protein [Xylocopilactobacillus apicola]|uniref:Uncharacterized protein n=1 Tax=Xylocopilactobacillus apicola TaxID=2932184 RepID=A0AAU9DL96_9LACO|nr:hypothetical protein [Xylocopilactobacillus apicola]BDR57657.1 hypothetical protein XA3_00980 [Xylocopilactobacillus apicola]
MLVKGNLYSINDIISYMKDSDKRDDNFSLYGESDEDLQSNNSYYVDDFPSVDDNGKEVYPPHSFETSVKVNVHHHL